MSTLEEFTALMHANDFALCEKMLVWFQAQHTIPSPIILQGATSPLEGVDRLRIADLLGWPSDFGSWGRLIDWLIASAPTLPVRLIPSALELLGVWQNALSDLPNPRSKNILQLCSTWLIDLEGDLYSEAYRSEGEWKDLSSEACSRLATSLRSTILRAARSYPEFATSLMDRAVANGRMRDKAYDDLMGFTPVLAEVMPDAVVKVAEAKLKEELPQDTYDRVRREEEEHFAWLKELRAKPKDQLTRHDQLALSSPHFPFSRSDIRYEQIGIEEHNGYYFPVSALHEPFASLLARSPEAGLRLIRNLSNHATIGWRQNLSLRREGTPLPVVLDFPWGRQEFWGGWRVYSWGQGELGPQPLECAYLALMYWACKEIEKGRSASEVIRLILEGSQSYASLGLCLCLALETREVSATTLPIVACQRLWQHDLQRLVQEPQKNIDLLGFGFLSRLTGEKAKAKAYLDQRKYRKREVRELAMLFALSPDDDLRERFRALLAAFPRDLPYEVEEQRSNAELTADLIKHAERWAGLGDRENYKKTEHQRLCCHPIRSAHTANGPGSRTTRGERDEPQQCERSCVGYEVFERRQASRRQDDV